MNKTKIFFHNAPYLILTVQNNFFKYCLMLDESYEDLLELLFIMCEIVLKNNKEINRYSLLIEQLEKKELAIEKLVEILEDSITVKQEYICDFFLEFMNKINISGNILAYDYQFQNIFQLRQAFSYNVPYSQSPHYKRILKKIYPVFN